MTQPAMRLHWQYGLFDPMTGTWCGNDEGVLLYDDLDLAMVSAAVANKQLGYKPGRIRPMMYDGTANKLRDTLPTKMGVVDALKELEEGKP